MKTALIGLGLTAIVTAVLYLVWGAPALVPGIAMGLVATGLQATAAGILNPVREAAFKQFVGRWGIGMGLRFLGVILVGVAVVVDRERFPPLPTGLGFLGVMVPLLFLELRRP